VARRLAAAGDTDLSGGRLGLSFDGATEAKIAMVDADHIGKIVLVH
jgi:hypothetical protein